MKGKRKNRRVWCCLIVLIVFLGALPSMSVDFSQEPSRLGSGQVLSMAFSPDGTTLAAWHRAYADWQTNEGELLLWDVQTQQQVGTLKKDSVSVGSIVFSPDGSLLALGCQDNTIQLWNLAGQNQVGVMQSPTVYGVESVAFSPDGKTLASCGSGNSTVCLWDVQTQKRVGVLWGHTGQGISCVAFSPDGNLLFSGGHRGDEPIRVWDVQTKQQVGELIGHLDITYELAFSPDGIILASAGGWYDKAVYLWDFEAQTQIGVLGPHSAHVGSVAFSPDGKLLVSTVLWDNTIHIWDIASRQEVGVLKGHDASDSGFCDEVAFSSDGRWLACESENGIELWDLILPGISPTDLNTDGKVDLKDLSILAQYWGQVGIRDVAVLTEYWLTEPSLVAHWKLDETEGFIAHDSAGDHHHGLVMALDHLPLWWPNDGKIDGALELDGIDDYVSTPFVLNPAEGQFSTFAWMKSSSAGQVILSQQADADWLLTVPQMGWLMTSLKDSDNSAIIVWSETVITDGNWHQVGLTWDRTTIVLYVDGIAVASDTQTALRDSTGGLHIGAAKNPSAGSFFSGLIDDVRIYNRAIVP